MSGFKPHESKRDEFRRYLESAGVLDALTKVLVSLYEEPEKPDDAIEYIRKHLGGICDTAVETKPSMEKKLEDAEAENRELRAKLAELTINRDEE